MSFQPIKVETSVIPHFHVIFTEKFITYIIFMFQGQFQGQPCKKWVFFFFKS